MITYTPLSGFYSHYSHYTYPLLFNKPSLAHRHSKYRVNLQSTALPSTWGHGERGHILAWTGLNSVTSGTCDNQLLVNSLPYAKDIKHNYYNY